MEPEKTGTNKMVIVGVVLVIVAIVVYVFMNSNKEAVVTSTASTEEKILADETIVEPATTTTVEPVTAGEVMVKAGSYEAYSPEKIALASANGNVVLNFYAAWCPKCRTLDKDINANLVNIPSSLTILKVDYDNSTDLKKKYGVTYQHTMVQVDKDGNLINKWSGPLTLTAFLVDVK